MNRIRTLLLLSVVALLVALVPAAAAQDQTFGLSADDYALLTAANNNSSAASSYDYAFTLTADLSSSGDAVNIALDGSGSFAEGFSMDVSGSIKASGDTQPAQLSLRVVGDSLFLSLDNGETWYGSTLDDLTSMGGAMLGGALPVDPEELASGDISGLEAQVGGLGDVMTGLDNLDPASFISMASAPADGGLVQFAINLDVAGLLNSPEMSQLMGAALMGAGGMGDMGAAAATPSPQELQMMGSMIGGMFSTATATLTQVVDPASQTVTQTTLAFALPLDMMGEAGDGVSLVFDISLSNYGAAAAVQAPASFEPLEEALSGFMGMMGAMGGM
jgi:hypothetical protein